MLNMNKTTPTDNFNLITLLTTTYESCDCLRQIYSPTISIRYDVKCIFDHYSRYISRLKDSANTYLLLFIADTNEGFIKNIYYSYAYRQQNNFPLPIQYNNINDERDLLDFVYYLAKEYIQENIEPNLNEVNDTYF